MNATILYKFLIIVLGTCLFCMPMATKQAEYTNLIYCGPRVCKDKGTKGTKDNKNTASLVMPTKIYKNKGLVFEMIGGYC